MVARVKTVAFTGIAARIVDVQVQITNGLPSFNLVGLPDKTVAESKERIRAALTCVGMALPAKKIIVNLSPANIVKEGSHYDLAITLGILIQLEVLEQSDVTPYLVLGELALDGSITPINGTLPSAIAAGAHGYGVICPYECGPEATWAENIEILAPKHLLALINHFKKTQILTPPQQAVEPEHNFEGLDIADIKGQEMAKYALEIAAAGGHNMFMYGPPGSGKSMLASRLPSILPPLEPKQALQVTMIHSIAGILKKSGVVRQAPYRDPHQGASLPALVGGGAKAKPGEISLAHMGVLFLDEIPEFSRSTLEALRQPLESGTVTIARVNAHVTYPAKIQLIAAMNPCPCGYFGDEQKADCSRAPQCAYDYQQRISGPLLDRIDLHVDVPSVSIQDLNTPNKGKTSAEIAKNVQKARTIQLNRYAKYRANNQDIYTNAQANAKILEEVLNWNNDAKSKLESIANKMKLSARGYHRVLRVAMTMADMEEAEKIEVSHIIQAIGFRKVA